MKTIRQSHTPSRRFRRPSSVRSLNEPIGSLKMRVSRRLADRYSSRLPAALVRRTVDDAEELARSTGFPHLFFPALAEEKVRLVFTFLSAEAFPPSPRFR